MTYHILSANRQICSRNMPMDENPAFAVIGGTDAAMAEAAELVRRANAYAEAVELLRRLLTHWNDPANEPDTFTEDGIDARAFLARLETP